MFGLSGGEILLLAVIALVLFGNEKLPENMKKMYRVFDKTKNTTKTIRQSLQEIGNDLRRSVEAETVSPPAPALPIARLAPGTISQEEIDSYQETLEKENLPPPGGNEKEDSFLSASLSSEKPSSQPT